jgi:hypothetical protein
MMTQIYCDVDDFCKDYEKKYQSQIITSGKHIRSVRKPGLSSSEIITILIYFHFSHYRTFKDYFMEYSELPKAFPDIMSYNRFVELAQTVNYLLIEYLLTHRIGKVTGIAFIDSTTLKVCLNQRIHSHKVFKDFARRGKNSMGWFFGFKLHLVVNECGELLSFCLTPGNVDDRNRSVIDKLTKRLFGKLFGDKGYIGKDLFKTLFENGIELITKLKKRMKNKLMPLMDKILLRKRAIIETINDQLKNECQIEHSRHRSPINFLGNLLSGLIAYTYQPKKPSLNLSPEEVNSLPARVF